MKIKEINSISDLPRNGRTYFVKTFGLRTANKNGDYHRENGPSCVNDYIDSESFYYEISGILVRQKVIYKKL